MNTNKQTWVLTGIVGLFASMVATASLIEYHTFDSDFSDAYGRTATGVGDAQITIDAVIGSGSLLLDGSGDSVALGTEPGLNQLNNWTVAAWIKPNSSADGIYAIFATPWTDGGAHFNYALTAGEPTVGIALYSNSENTSTSSNVPPSGWFHVAATRGDNSALRIYINGVEETSVGMSGALTDLGLASNIGSWDTARYFSGQIDDFRIYDEALSAAQVSALVVPEPGSMILIGLGLLTMVFGRRRFRK